MESIPCYHVQDAERITKPADFSTFKIPVPLCIEAPLLGDLSDFAEVHDSFTDGRQVSSDPLVFVVEYSMDMLFGLAV